MIIYTMNVIFLDYQILIFFSLLNICKRSHGKHSLTLSDLSIILKQSGHRITLSRLVTFSNSSLHNLDI